MSEEEGRISIINNSKDKKVEKERLKNGQIVYCRGQEGSGSFYGIVYEYGILELPCGSNAYINTTKPLHIGDTIGYWTIEKAYKKINLIIEE